MHRKWPEAVAGDKGHSGTEIRKRLAEREIVAVILKRPDETGPNVYDREPYRERPVVGQAVNCPKRWRRSAT